MTDLPHPHPHPPFALGSQRLGALPIVQAFLGRAGVQRVLGRYLPAGDARVALRAASVIGVLIGNLCVAREALYGLGDWAGRHDPTLLGLQAGQAGLLNDDRVGRALDQLFAADVKCHPKPLFLTGRPRPVSTSHAPLKAPRPPHRILPHSQRTDRRRGRRHATRLPTDIGLCRPWPAWPTPRPP
jgi:hypothetical protein